MTTAAVAPAPSAAPDSGAPSPRAGVCVLVFGALAAALGVASVVAPGFIARRFAAPWGDEASLRAVMRAAGPALVLMGAGAFLTTSAWYRARGRAATWLLALMAVAGYASLTACLWDWMIDDAAITFAYSKNLADGHGLVIRPGHAPEEGYSNTSWMLILAAARALGADIATTAKRLSMAFGALAVLLSLVVSDEVSERRARFGLLALGASICIGAPFVIWSSSGLEHGLQAALLAVVVAAPLWPRFERALMAGAFSLLVLTRPEAPLMVVSVFAVLVARDGSWTGAREAVRRYWPVAVVPALTWAVLVIFRLGYFHDAMSNPYYAKSGEATPGRIVNLAGRGWTYVFGWLTDARAWLLLPLLLMAPARRAPLPYQLAAVICLAQLPFVLYFGGDWMGCYRFIAPVLPLLAIVVVHAVAEGGKRWARLAGDVPCLVLAWALGMGTVGQLATFRAGPTTPTAVVARIGKTFVEVGNRLGIEHPSLAHHDAGGTSYEAGIDLLDLAGLADRVVAKHLTDRAFMRKYIFEERRPTFVFGTTTTFAAGRTQFHLMPEFAEQYVPLRFPGRPYMKADLCHVRRDAIHAVPGIHQVKAGASDGPTDYWVVD